MVANAQLHLRRRAGAANLNRCVSGAVLAGILDQIHEALHHPVAIRPGLQAVGIDAVSRAEKKLAFASPLGQGNRLLHRLANTQGLELELQAAGFGSRDRQQARDQPPQPTALLLDDRQLMALVLGEVVGTPQQTAAVAGDQGDRIAQLVAHGAGELPLTLKGLGQAIQQLVEGMGKGLELVWFLARREALLLQRTGAHRAEDVTKTAQGEQAALNSAAIDDQRQQRRHQSCRGEDPIELALQGHVRAHVLQQIKAPGGFAQAEGRATHHVGAAFGVKGLRPGHAAHLFFGLKTQRRRGDDQIVAAELGQHHAGRKALGMPPEGQIKGGKVAQGSLQRLRIHLLRTAAQDDTLGPAHDVQLALITLLGKHLQVHHQQQSVAQQHSHQACAFQTPLNRCGWCREQAWPPWHQPTWEQHTHFKAEPSPCRPPTRGSPSKTGGGLGIKAALEAPVLARPITKLLLQLQLEQWKRGMVLRAESRNGTIGQCIQQHPILIGPLKINHAIEPVRRTATHQHLSLPDRRRCPANGVNDHSAAPGIGVAGPHGEGEHGSPSAEGARPGFRGGWIDHPALSGRDLGFDQRQRAALQPCGLKALGHGRTQPQVGTDQSQQQRKQRSAQTQSQQQLQQGEAPGTLAIHHRVSPPEATANTGCCATPLPPLGEAPHSGRCD